MKWYQRIELWFLAAVVAGVLFFVLGSGSPDDAVAARDEKDPSTESGTVIHRRTLERDHGNARLDLDISHTNTSEARFPMQPPAVRLMTGAGREVPSFFLPFSPPPEIAAGARQEVRLRYWLEKADLAGALMLEIEGRKMPVKSAAPFDLESLENKKPRSFTREDWR
jgi:hypothetical protein